MNWKVGSSCEVALEKTLVKHSMILQQVTFLVLLSLLLTETKFFKGFIKGGAPSKFGTKAPTVECPLIPLIDLQSTSERYSINILPTPQLTLDWHPIPSTSQSIVGQHSADY